MTTQANETTALARHESRDMELRTDKSVFEPRDMSEAMQLAQKLVAGRLLPKSVATAEAAFTIIVTGRELGLSAMQSLRGIHVIEGKPTLSADLMVSLVKKSPECVFFRLVETTAQIATYETRRQGEPEPTRMSFTIAQAHAAQVTGKDNWKKYPDAMLRARCASSLARAVYPDLVMGIYDPDELEPARQEPPVDVTPPRRPTQPRQQSTVTVEPARPVIVETPAQTPPYGAETGEVIDAQVSDVSDATEPSGAFLGLRNRFEKAATLDDLNKITRDVTTAKNDGLLQPGERDALLDVYKARKAAIAQKGAA